MTITRLKASIFQAVFTSPILTFTVLFHLNLFFLKKINSQSPYYESNTSFLKTHLPFFSSESHRDNFLLARGQMRNRDGKRGHMCQMKFLWDNWQ